MQVARLLQFSAGRPGCLSCVQPQCALLKALLQVGCESDLSGVSREQGQTERSAAAGKPAARQSSAQYTETSPALVVERGDPYAIRSRTLGVLR
jgi:hypothetical protein